MLYGPTAPTANLVVPDKMQISASFPPANNRERGFTLIEILVVLLIAALVSGIVIPQAFKLMGTYRHRGERDIVRQKIDQLPLRAYETGRKFVLSNSHSLKLPAGWRLNVISPINYSINGQCTSGKLSLKSPEGKTTPYTITPPACKLKKTPLGSGL